jgi:hypothetical protein
MPRPAAASHCASRKPVAPGTIGCTSSTRARRCRARVRQCQIHLREARARSPDEVAVLDDHRRDTAVGFERDDGQMTFVHFQIFRQSVNSSGVANHLINDSGIDGQTFATRPDEWHRHNRIASERTASCADVAELEPVRDVPSASTRRHGNRKRRRCSRLKREGRGARRR